MKDIYTITPELEAQLTHAITLLEDIIFDSDMDREAIDDRVMKVADILKSLPFFAKNY
jgi:hypothetical protein